MPWRHPCPLSSNPCSSRVTAASTLSKSLRRRSYFLGSDPCYCGAHASLSPVPCGDTAPGCNMEAHACPWNMSPHLSRGIAETDREFDEHASDASMAGGAQLTSARVPTSERMTRLRSHASQIVANEHLGSDVAVDENQEITSTEPNLEGPRARKGRKVTINDKLRKRRAKGKQIDIKFPKQFGKVCCKHASLFKSEILVIVRAIPLRVKKWKEMDDFHPGTTVNIWRKLQLKFPELLQQDKDCAMRQVESQNNNRRYRLCQAYKKNQPRPVHVSLEDWQWLIRNVWANADFQTRSNQNSLNRAKQEMRSKVGTQSITQIAYDPRDPGTREWTTAMQVWRATYQKTNGTWSIPTGEETMAKLSEVAVTHQERISSAPVPIVEQFALVLGRKPNHSRGVGIRAVNRVAEERIRLQAQIEASKEREAAARARADAAEHRVEVAEQRAQALEGQVSTVVEANAQLLEEQQAQRNLLSSIVKHKVEKSNV